MMFIRPGRWEIRLWLFLNVAISRRSIYNKKHLEEQGKEKEGTDGK